MWTVEAISRDLLINLVAGTLIFVVGLYWPLVTSFLRRDRFAFRRLFGTKAIEVGYITVTLDTYRDLRLLPVEVRQKLGIKQSQSNAPGEGRFFKIFPNGHLTIFPGAYSDILGYCSARASAYLIDSLGSVPGITIKAVSDATVGTQWDGTFINLGSSASNVKTDDIKHLQNNLWLVNDTGAIELSDGRVITMEDGKDKGVIMKLINPYFAGHSLLICAGLGEWGTSGAAWFLSAHWRAISHRFGEAPFLLVVSVTPESDESAREILALSSKSQGWGQCLWLYLKKRLEMLQERVRGKGIS